MGYTEVSWDIADDIMGNSRPRYRYMMTYSPFTTHCHLTLLGEWVWHLKVVFIVVEYVYTNVTSVVRTGDLVGGGGRGVSYDTLSTCNMTGYRRVIWQAIDVSYDTLSTYHMTRYRRVIWQATDVLYDTISTCHMTRYRRVVWHAIDALYDTLLMCHMKCYRRVVWQAISTSQTAIRIEIKLVYQFYKIIDTQQCYERQAIWTESAAFKTSKLRGTNSLT